MIEIRRSNARPKRVALLVVLASLLLVLLAPSPTRADSATIPSVGPIKVERGSFFIVRSAWVKVRVVGAGRVVVQINGRKHEAHPGKPAECGARPCRWWFFGVSSLKRGPIPLGFAYMVNAINSSGSRKVVGARCDPSLWCQPYRVECSSLSSEEWLRIRESGGASRQAEYFRDLKGCGILLGLTRDEVVAYLGRPDREGRTYASWDLGFDFIGDTITGTVDLRLGKVVRVQSY